MIMIITIIKTALIDICKYSLSYNDSMFIYNSFLLASKL